QLVDEFDGVGQPPASDMPGQMFADLDLADIASVGLDAYQQRALVPFRVRDADCSGFGNAGAPDGGIFKLDRTDPFSARLDNILRSVGDLQGPVRMNCGHVTGIEP